jgi:hypothetical protein
MWLSVGEEGVALLQHSSLQLLAKYSYGAIVTFGGCQVGNLAGNFLEKICSSMLIHEPKSGIRTLYMAFICTPK